MLTYNANEAIMLRVLAYGGCSRDLTFKTTHITILIRIVVFLLVNPIFVLLVNLEYIPI